MARIFLGQLVHYFGALIEAREESAWMENRQWKHKFSGCDTRFDS